MAKKKTLFILIGMFIIFYFILVQKTFSKTVASDSNMTLLARLPVGECKTVATFNTNYAIIESGRGVRILDLIQKQYPLMISAVPTAGHVSDIFINGSYAYITTDGTGYYVDQDFTGGLAIVDVSDPAHPHIEQANFDRLLYIAHIQNKYITTFSNISIRTVYSNVLTHTSSIIKRF